MLRAEQSTAILDGMFKASLAFLYSLTGLLAQDIRHINPAGMAKSPGYSQVVAAKPREIIWIAGQVAQNSKGEVVGKGDLKA